MTWQPDEFLPADNILITATHLFVGGAKATYAIDLATQQEAWRYGLARPNRQHGLF